MEGNELAECFRQYKMAEIQSPGQMPYFPNQYGPASGNMSDWDYGGEPEHTRSSAGKIFFGIFVVILIAVLIGLIIWYVRKSETTMRWDTSTNTWNGSFTVINNSSSGNGIYDATRANSNGTYPIVLIVPSGTTSGVIFTQTVIPSPGDRLTTDQSNPPFLVTLPSSFKTLTISSDNSTMTFS